MPRILPSLPDVQWPADEGVIGIVGVAPWATLDFLAQIYAQVSARKDWDFPRVLVDANSKIPSRGRYFDLDETDPSTYIADTIDELVASGATVVVVPCNTAHVLFDRWSQRAANKIVSIIQATLDAIDLPVGSKIAVLGSTHLVHHGTYNGPLSQRGLVPVTFTQSQQALIGRCIGEIKTSNSVAAETKGELIRFFDDLHSNGTTEIVLGCTELAQAMRCLPSNVFKGHIVDSNVELAKSVLKRV